MERYSKLHKRSWKYDEREIPYFLEHWFKRKLSDINREDVVTLHDQIGKDSGPYAANRLLERLRGMYNRAIEWGWEGKNPATKIKKFREKSRERFIQPDELPFFFEALSEELNETARDYILLSLLLGARKANMFSMRWDEINLKKSSWHIPETKNGEPFSCVISSIALDILEKRNAKSESDWVFPGKGKKGYLADPKKAWGRICANATLKKKPLNI